MLEVMKQKGLEDSLARVHIENDFCLQCNWRKINLNRSSTASHLFQLTCSSIEGYHL